MSPQSPSHRAWIKQLPKSEMVYPEEFTHRMKYYFFRIYTPYHPAVRNSAIALKIIEKSGRQRYLLGKIAPHISIEEFVSFLVEKGYAYHRVAWEDDGELVSLRHVENFIYQYHVRIFADGEVRGHFEYTPESYPLRHLRAEMREDRRDDFFKLVEDRLVPHMAPDQSNHQWEILPHLRRRLRQMSF